jgi:hypothetical protein
MLSGWIWIDALCINQRDLTERDYQVAIMEDIFRTVNKVRI